MVLFIKLLARIFPLFLTSSCRCFSSSSEAEYSAVMEFRHLELRKPPRKTTFEVTSRSDLRVKAKKEKTTSRSEGKTQHLWLEPGELIKSGEWAEYLGNISVNGSF